MVERNNLKKSLEKFRPKFFVFGFRSKFSRTEKKKESRPGVFFFFSSEGREDHRYFLLINRSLKDAHHWTLLG